MEPNDGSKAGKATELAIEAIIKQERLELSRRRVSILKKWVCCVTIKLMNKKFYYINVCFLGAINNKPEDS